MPQRTTPAVNITTAGSTLVSYWADKSSATTGWTLPADVTLRNQQVGSPSGHIAAAVGDSGALPPGPNGSKTAVANSANQRGVVWSIVLVPNLGPAN